MDKRQFLIIAVLAGVAGMSPPAHADAILSGEYLQGLCADYYRPANTAACRGYVKGVADVLAKGEVVGGYKACMIETANDDRLVEIVTGYLDRAGERKGDPATLLVAKALAESYPCEK